MSDSLSPAARARVDLHLHSWASTDTGSWLLGGPAIPESYTDPETAYRRAKERGMDFVTLSDHNTIAGALEIAHHPDAFVSVEATVEFPEDRTPVHVLIWGVAERTWDDIDRLRGNLYELVEYVVAADLPYALAHPLHRVGLDFSQAHAERCLLLFPIWEGRNGARPREGNEIACRIAQAASPEFIAKLADKHEIAPRVAGPPALVAGSDDHGLFDVAATWTELPPAADVRALLDRLRAGETELAGAHGSTDALAHSVGTLGVKTLMRRGALGLPAQLGEVIADLINDPVPPPTGPGEVTKGAPFGDELLAALRRDRRFRRRFSRAGKERSGPPREHRRLRMATDWLHEELIRAALGRRRGLGERIEGLLAGAALAAPYLLAAGYLAGEERFAREFGRHFLVAADPGIPVPPPRVGMFTDTYDELNGVAGTMRRLTAHAARRADGAMTVVACGSPQRSAGLARFRAIGRVPVPAHGDGGWQLGIPSLIELLDFAERERVEVFHAAAPGPMGLAALLLARTLGRPFVASYHTELGRYAAELTGDRLAASIASRAVDWFYAQADRIYVPSAAAGAGIQRRIGIADDRLVRFGRGADVAGFDPAHRSRWWRHRLGRPSGTTLLYVGRLSREKGLLPLAAAFRQASAERPGLQLAIVGEGPGRAELAEALAGTRHRFLGAHRGPALAGAFASADIFCLPSETETFGQVVVEAAASGLPAIVVDRGGAPENVVDGETGVVVRAGEVSALAAAIGRLADDAGERRRMGAAARARAVGRPGWDETFTALIGTYGDLTRSAEAVPSAVDIRGVPA